MEGAWVCGSYSENQSIGIATNFLYQRFEAKGISGFAPFSNDGKNLSNKGKDSAGLGCEWAGVRN